MVTALVASFGLMLYRTDEGGSPLAPSFGAFCAVVLAIAVALQIAAIRRGTELGRRYGEHAAAAFALTASFALVIPPEGLPELWVPVAATLLGLLALLAATRLASGPWSLAATAVTALVHSAWTFDRPTSGGQDPGLAFLSSFSLLPLVLRPGHWRAIPK